MLTLTANFNGEQKTLKVSYIVDETFYLEDGSRIDRHTLSIVFSHPEIILHPVKIPKYNGDFTIIWQ